MSKRVRNYGDLEDVFVLCRATSHDWEPISAWRSKRQRRAVRVIEYVCGRERRAGIDEPNRKTEYLYEKGRDAYRIAASRYAHADGYLLEPGTGIGRGKHKLAARAEMLSRMRQWKREGTVVPLRKRNAS